MPHRITIDDSDIRAVEIALGDVRFDDDHRMAALRFCESCDIQACPGSGKTTLLVAKLAILARKWRWRDRGILVLSHTNVARHEIQERVSHTGFHKVLTYPHFVGTIQKFTNHFLALPYLRNSGILDYRIDDKLFGERAVDLLTNSQVFSTASRSLELRHKTGIVQGLRYEGSELTLGCALADIPFREDTLTVKQLKRLKDRISYGDLIFRFDDMFAFAESYLKEHTSIARALRYRFPWVFIDEMQDTDELQERLLRLAFGSEASIQCIGDTNQAIFGSAFAKETPTSFPLEGALQLPGSLRFCPKIAEFSRPLTRAQDYQAIQGNSQVASRKHTIFTFERATINEVLPAFGRLLEEEYLEGLPRKFRAKAVGARKTKREYREEYFPYCISDYFSLFSLTAGRERNFSSLSEFVLSARLQFEKSGEFSESWTIVIDCCLELLKIQGIFNPTSADDVGARQRRYSRASLLEQLSLADHERSLRLLTFALLNGRVDLSDQFKWQTFSDELCNLLARGIGITDWSANSKDFCKWVQGDTSIHDSVARKPNLFLHRSTGRGPDIEIELSTIHAAKGETHTATLVLDTFERTHDLKSVLPFLIDSTKKISDADRKRMKRTFVAMTRPRELLCLAMRRDHLDKKKTARAKLVEMGWNIVDL